MHPINATGCNLSINWSNSILLNPLSSLRFTSQAVAAFTQAYWAALASGSSVLMSENGNLVEIFPDGKRKIIKPLPPSTKVTIGQKLKIR